MGDGVDYTYLLSTRDDDTRTVTNYKNKDDDVNENGFSFKIVGVDIGIVDKWGSKVTAGIMIEAEEKELLDKKTSLLLQMLEAIQEFPTSKANLRKEFAAKHDGANKARDFSDALGILVKMGKYSSDNSTVNKE